MEKIRKKYDEAVGKFTDRIASLEELNQQASEELAMLDARYRSAVVADDDQAEKIKRQVTEKQREIDDLEDRITVLKENMKAVRKKAANTAAREYAKERGKQAAAGRKASEAVRKAKEAYIAAVVKAERQDLESTDQRVETRFTLKHADESIIQDLELEKERDEPVDFFRKFFNWKEHAIHHEEIWEDLFNK